MEEAEGHKILCYFVAGMVIEGQERLRYVAADEYYNIRSGATKWLKNG
jgi:hypothetical protein